MVSSLNATLIDRHDLTPELAIVKIRPDSGVAPEFEPGQFVEVALPAPPRSEVEAVTAQLAAGDPPRRARLMRRAYSIASAKRVRDHVELYIVLVERGRLTPRIWPLRTGDRLWMDAEARGHFTLDGIPRGSDIIAIATGTGLAPYISMLRTYRGSGKWNRFTLIHGVRKVADLAYRDELEALAKAERSIGYVPAVSRDVDNSDYAGIRGRVMCAFDDPHCARIFGGQPDPARTHVLLCGNPEMIKSMQTQLESRGFVTATKQVTGNIHFERYW